MESWTVKSHAPGRSRCSMHHTIGNIISQKKEAMDLFTCSMVFSVTCWKMIISDCWPIRNTRATACSSNLQSLYLNISLQRGLPMSDHTVQDEYPSSWMFIRSNGDGAVSILVSHLCARIFGTLMTLRECLANAFCSRVHLRLGGYLLKGSLEPQ